MWNDKNRADKPGNLVEGTADRSCDFKQVKKKEEEAVNSGTLILWTQVIWAMEPVISLIYSV